MTAAARRAAFAAKLANAVAETDISEDNNWSRDELRGGPSLDRIAALSDDQVVELHRLVAGDSRYTWLRDDFDTAHEFAHHAATAAAESLLLLHALWNEHADEIIAGMQ